MTSSSVRVLLRASNAIEATRPPPKGAAGHRLAHPERHSSMPRRSVAVACGLFAALLIGLSYTKPWWSFLLYAPQYPSGLGLQVSLTGVTGDVQEIDTLNHYIGMASLSLAAPLERAVAAYAVAGIVFALIAGLVARRRWLIAVLTLPAAAFPVGFLLDTSYWLHRFGHDLDPRAPLEIPPFMPELFGNGAIGQFLTFAKPESGFWLATAGAALAILGLWGRLGAPRWRGREAPKEATS